MSQVYRVTIAPTAQKFIDRKAPHNMRARLQAACEGLGVDPRPYGYIKLEGRDTYRIREGDYRIEYRINDKDVAVDVIEVEHRKNMYK